MQQPCCTWNLIPGLSLSLTHSLQYLMLHWASDITLHITTLLIHSPVISFTLSTGDVMYLSSGRGVFRLLVISDPKEAREPQ